MRREQNSFLTNPTELSNTMYPPREFVMISQTFSDGVSVRKDGPRIKKEFRSERVLKRGKTFRTAATFVPKLVPKHFVTTLTVADELTYYESVEFERRTVMGNFSETTVLLPRETTNKYRSSLFFDPDATTRRYVAGVELMPARKFVVTENSNFEGECCSEKNAVNGEIGCQKLINGRM